MTADATTTVVIDGELVAPGAATISIFDRGLLYGDGLFEVLRTWDGVAIDLPAHLDRLAASAHALALPIDRDALAAAVARAVAAGPGGDQRVRIIATRGPGALGARLASLTAGRTIVIVEPLPARPSALAAITIDIPARRGANHKTLAYLDHVLRRELAAAAGADEAIGIDPSGHVVEGATSNVFAVTAGALITPPIAGGALPGIVRDRVLALASAAGIATTVRALAADELRAADELFVTSSLRGAVPITRLDGEARVAGPVAAALARLYDGDCEARRKCMGSGASL